jgi:hypothetical protein
VVHAIKGDHVVVHGRHVGNTERRGVIIDIRGSGGTPPYVVRWEPDDEQNLFFPGPDCHIESDASR